MIDWGFLLQGDPEQECRVCGWQPCGGTLRLEDPHRLRHNRPDSRHGGLAWRRLSVSGLGCHRHAGVRFRGRHKPAREGQPDWLGRTEWENLVVVRKISQTAFLSFIKHLVEFESPDTLNAPPPSQLLSSLPPPTPPPSGWRPCTAWRRSWGSRPGRPCWSTRRPGRWAPWWGRSPRSRAAAWWARPAPTPRWPSSRSWASTGPSTTRPWALWTRRWGRRRRKDTTATLRTWVLEWWTGVDVRLNSYVGFTETTVPLNSGFS